MLVLISNYVTPISDLIDKGTSPTAVNGSSTGVKKGSHINLSSLTKIDQIEIQKDLLIYRGFEYATLLTGFFFGSLAAVSAASFFTGLVLETNHSSLTLTVMKVALTTLFAMDSFAMRKEFIRLNSIKQTALKILKANHKISQELAAEMKSDLEKIETKLFNLKIFVPVADLIYLAYTRFGKGEAS
jgi:hypothetical protein